VSFLKLDKYLDRLVRTSVPGIVCWIGDHKNTLFFESYGYAQRVPRRVKIRKDTIFDLASLTKPFTTAIAIMNLISQKKLSINAQVHTLIPEFKKTPNGRITIYQLLTHTAGLPGWFPLYLLPGNIRMAFLANTTTYQKRVEYSCLGYILLGLIIERITTTKLDTFCQRHIYQPNGLKSLRFRLRTKRNVAATEHGDLFERNMAAEYSDQHAHTWRNYVIRGEVHDGNCFYAYDRVSGNAGLFGTAADCGRFLRLYSNGNIVPKRIFNDMVRDHTGGPEKRGLGWWVDPYPGVLSPRTFAHTGFTGTMVCVDPDTGTIVVLLTNAIHPLVRQEVKKRLRRRVVEIVAKTQP